MFHKFFTSMVLGVALVAGTAGCTPMMQTRQVEVTPYADLAPIHLKVKKISVVDQYTSPGEAPYVDQMFETSPAQAITSWAGEKLMADGGQEAVAELVINKAFVREVPLATTGGLQGWFYNDQAVWYQSVADVTLIAKDVNGAKLAEVTANVFYSHSAPESAISNGKNEIWSRINDKIISDLHQELLRNVRLHLTDFMVKK